ncbi:hypothetical protein [Ottowia sp.]|uniref:hypothetical protein n=1 Tax=Ottowia sp. TaxID=1898956 RepID=UPI0025D05A64|nr:hypothetical protein [Ottowia sp.]MBK6616700.1 hypothetical protein [Ottowia sp.]
MARDEAAASEVRAKAEAARKQADQKTAEQYMERVPQWALVPPPPDVDGIYAVGIAESSRMDMATRKSMLTAEFGLAKSLKAVVSGSERQYQRDSGRAGLTERYTLLIDQVVDRVPLAGYHVVKREVRPIDGTYHSFVLLRLSYDQLGKALASAKQAESDASIDEQFAELERRLDKYREQRLAESQASVVARAAAIGAASAGASKLAPGALGADGRSDGSVLGAKPE